MADGFGGANLGSARGDVFIGVAQAMSNLRQLQGGIGGLGQSAAGVTPNFVGLGLALTGIGAAVGKGFKDVITTTAQFEKNMSNVAAAIGEDALPALDDLHDTAIRIGQDTAFSANDAALAMEELAKAGVSAEDIINGVADGTVNLAAAIGSDLPTAAGLVTTALAVFNLTAADTVDVTDTITAAINESKADVNDYQAGFRNLAPVVANFGGTVEDAAAAVAYFTNFGLKGADAGISLARGIQFAATPTAEATDLMNQLGIAVFDAQGQFVGFPELFRELNVALGDADDQTREAALSMIFGQEAADVMGIAVKNGAEGYNELRAAVEPAGQAAETAATRMDNLSGDTEKLSGSIETLKIRIGEGITPVLRDFVQLLDRVVNAVSGLPAPMLRLLAAAVGLVGAFAALAGARILGRLAWGGILSAIAELGPGLGLVSAPILGVVAALALLGAAFHFNLFGIRGVVERFASFVAKAFGGVVSVISGAIDVFRVFGGLKLDGHGADRALGAIYAAGAKVQDVLGDDAAIQFVATMKSLQVPIRNLTVDLQVLRRAGRDWFGVLAGNNVNLDKFGDRLDHVFGKGVGAKVLKSTLKLSASWGILRDSISEEFGIDTSSWASWDNIILQTGILLKELIRIFRFEFLPAVGEVLSFVQNNLSTAFLFLARHMGTIASVVGTVAGLFGHTLFNGLAIVGNLLKGDFGAAVDRAMDILNDFLDVGGSLLDWVLNVGVPHVITWTQNLWDWLVDVGAPWIADLAGDILDWTLNVGVPHVIGWLRAAAGHVWAALQLAAGWVWDRLVDLGKWTLNTAVPTIGGWLAFAAKSAWAALQMAAGWIWSRAEDLGNWTLNTAVPTVIGWVKFAARNTWAAIQLAAGWIWDRAVELGKWTLNTAVPAVTGWIVFAARNSWAALLEAAGWIWDRSEELGGWTLHTLVPVITGWLSRVIADPWKEIKAASGWVADAVDGQIKINLEAQNGTIQLVSGFVDNVRERASAILKFASGQPVQMRLAVEVDARGAAEGGGGAGGGGGINWNPFQNRITQSIRENLSDENSSVNQAIGNAAHGAGALLGKLVLAALTLPFTSPPAVANLLSDFDPAGIYKGIWDAIIKPVVMPVFVAGKEFVAGILQPFGDALDSITPQQFLSFFEGDSVAQSLIRGVLIALDATKVSVEQFAAIGRTIASGMFTATKTAITTSIGIGSSIISAVLGAISKATNLQPISFSGLGGSIASSLFGAIKLAFTPSWAWDIVTGIFDAIKGAGNITAANFADVGTAIGGAIKDALVNGIKGGADWAKAIVDAIIDAIKDQVPLMKSLVGAALSDALSHPTITGGGLRDSIKSALGDPKAAFSGFDTKGLSFGAPDTSKVASAVSGLSSQISGATIKIQTAMAGLAATVGGQAALISAALAGNVGGSFTRAQGTATAAAGAMKSGVSSAFNAVESVTQQAWGGAAQAVTQRSNTMRSVVTTTAGQIQQQGTRGATEYQRATTTQFGQASSAVDRATGQIKSTTGTTASAVQTAGQKGGSGFRGGISDGMDGSVAAAIRGRGGILQALNLPSLYSQGFGVGASLGDGISAGIASRVSNIANAAAGAVGAAIDAANAKAQRGSPSRVMIAWGQDFIQGGIVGIFDRLNALAAASGTAAGAAVDAATGAVGNASMAADFGTFVGAGAGNGAGGNTTIINIGAVDVSTAEDIVRWGNFVGGLSSARARVRGGE